MAKNQDNPKSALAEPAREGRRGARVTVRDIAEELGVSVATVSRAFAADGVISPKTRQRVLEAADAMGYQPNPFARSLITRRSRIAALVAADITNPFYPEVLANLTKRLKEAGLQTMLFFAGPGSKVDDALPTLLQYTPDIAIVLAATMSSDMVAACRNAGTPVLLFNRYVPGSGAAAVCCDNVGGGRLAAEALARAGHRRLAYLAGQPDTSTNLDRLRGFVEGCADLGLEPPLVEEGGSYTYEAGYQGIKHLFDRRQPPEAVFCANDIVAIGALDSARRELGLTIPKELSIVGFDDISMAAWPSYSLTTVRQPVNAMIDVALGEVERVLGRRSEAAQEHFLPGRLIRRGSAILEEVG